MTKAERGKRKAEELVQMFGHRRFAVCFIACLFRLPLSAFRFCTP